MVSVQKRLPKTAFTQRPKKDPVVSPRVQKAAMTESQRQTHVRQALTRFVRNKNLPAEMEDLRHNLIVARVMQGMLAVEAAEKFGYANSTQLSLIESGERKVPSDHKFIKQAAQVYSVSIDWLLGLSPHMEPDTKVAHQYALLRGTESVMSGFVDRFAAAMIQHTNETLPMASDFETVITGIDEVVKALETLRAKGKFDNLPGGSAVSGAIERLSGKVAPLRKRLKTLKGIDSYMTEVRNGTMPSIPYLTERYSQTDLRLES